MNGGAGGSCSRARSSRRRRSSSPWASPPPHPASPPSAHRPPPHRTTATASQRATRGNSNNSSNNNNSNSSNRPRSRRARSGAGRSSKPRNKPPQQQAAQQAAAGRGREGRCGSGRQAKGRGRGEEAGRGSWRKALAAAQARAAKEAAQRAAAAQRGAITWSQRGKPQKLVIVRATSIDSVAGGSWCSASCATAARCRSAALDAAIPSSWMTINGDTARLNAAVVLTPGTLLDVEGVQTLQLAGGTDATDAAFLYTGSGRIQLRNVTVTSIDPASGQPVTADAAGRPVHQGLRPGQARRHRCHVSDLGTKPIGDDPGSPAIAFGRGSTGTLNGTTLQRNSTGLLLAESQGVRLQDVTADDSTRERHRAARRPRHRAVRGQGRTQRRQRGARDGRRSPPPDHRDHHHRQPRLRGVGGRPEQRRHQRPDPVRRQAGGLELNRDTDSRVHNITTTDEPNGVFLHVNSANVLLDAMTINGGRTGILAEKTTTGLHVTASTINNAHVAGMQIGGHDTLLERPHRQRQPHRRCGSNAARAASPPTSCRSSAATTGWSPPVAPAASWSTTCPPTASTTRCRTLSSGLQITGGQIRGGPTGMDLQAATTVNGIQIGLTTTGIRARAPDPITLDAVTRRRRVRRRRGPTGQRGHAARLDRARAAGRPRHAHPARRQRSQPAAAEPPRRDRPAPDPARRVPGGHAPAAVAEVRTDPPHARLRSRWVRDEPVRRPGRLAAAAAALGLLARRLRVVAPARAGAPHGAPPVTSDLAKPCTKAAGRATRRQRAGPGEPIGRCHARHWIARPTRSGSRRTPGSRSTG